MSREIKLSYLKDPTVGNPLDNIDYTGFLLWIYPAMREELSRRVTEISTNRFAPIKYEWLNDNSWLVSKRLLDTLKRLLLIELWTFENLVWESKVIYIVCDDCFTNELLIKVIKWILWEEGYKNHVEVIGIDYDKEADDKVFENIWDNKLFILWWSLKDPHNIHPSHYNSALSRLIKSAWTSMHRNNRFIWVCFWNQHIWNLHWIEQRDTSSPVTITYRWPAQFWPSVCSVNLNEDNAIYFDLLRWLTNGWVNTEITAFFTRTWYVSHDALWIWELNVVPLIVDRTTWTIVCWWSENWNIMWVQFHPEISFFEDEEFLLRNIKEILKMLEPHYENPMELLANFDFEAFKELIKRDIGEEFYTFVIYFFLKSILDKIIALKLSKSTETWEELDYDVALRKVIENIRERVGCEVWKDVDLFSKELSRRFLLSSDARWKLVINRVLDWKVNRWIKEVSRILWIRNIWDFTIKHKEAQEKLTWKKWIYYFVDLWAGDWTLLKEMYTEYKNQDIIFYWVADKIYVEVFPLLRKIWESMWIPLKVIVLFLETFLLNFSNASGSLYKKVISSLANIDIHSMRTLHYWLIMNRDRGIDTETKMFSDEGEEELDRTTMHYISHNPDVIEKLKNTLESNIFDFFEWYFERINISTFRDFFSQRELWTGIDGLVSVRATSHVDWVEYLAILLDYISDFALLWSYAIDNWVHQSYTSIPRVMELARLAELAWSDVRVRLVYDESTNYFAFAFIEKAPFLDFNFHETELCPWYKMVSVVEAAESTFFQLEYFLRSFIAINFKDNNVFREFNKDIMNTIKVIMNDLKNWEKSWIKILILNLINYIARNFKNDNIDYNPINMEILEKYSIWWMTLDDIINRDIYTPDWMNLEANRKY